MSQAETTEISAARPANYAAASASRTGGCRAADAFVGKGTQGTQGTKGIDLRLARICVELSAQAYEEATIESELAHCLYTPETTSAPAILAFRGSHCMRDWLTNAQCRLAYTTLGRLHTGFWESTSGLMGQVMKLDQRSLPAPVVVTGHSKGAAEALICAAYLAMAKRPVLAVVTFGGPRVGDSFWRAKYNGAGDGGQRTDGGLGKRTFRWVHEEDIVPRTPPWISGCRHVGQEAFMCSFGGVELNPHLWHKAASDLWGTFWGITELEVDQATDHPVGKYMGHIKRL